ncbi:MAG: 3-sulfinopropanoyl-CoA desulfinase [Pseudomonadota bacterium]
MGFVEQDRPVEFESQRRARALAQEKFSVRAAHFDKTRKYCHRNVRDMVDAGLMGMTIPEVYGGKGASLYETVLAIEEVARACTLSARVLTEANMGAIGAIMAYGTEDQKRLCAPFVLAGDKAAICITEPEAGSAATEMRTTAVKRGDHYVINGHKHWITGGGVSKIHLIFARVIGDAGVEEGIGAFIVIRDRENGYAAEGLEIGERERTMGLCGMPETEILFRDLKVDQTMRLETPSGSARGFQDLMTAYNAQRVGAGTIAMGVAAGALDEAKRYMLERQQFGRPIAEFQGLQWMIADMDAALYASRLMLHDAAKSASEGNTPFPDMTKAARAKLFASENAIKIVNQALQIFGARGYGSEEKVERMYRDVRMFTIGGGTAEILRNQLASAVLDMKLPQTRDAYIDAQQRAAMGSEVSRAFKVAAE